MSPNCSNCGRALRAGARFCPHCGTPIGAPAGGSGIRAGHPPTTLLGSQPRLLVRMRGRADLDSALTGQVVTVGRDPAVNAIVVEEMDVSRQHARFLPQGQGYAVEDLNSSNGTHVGGKRIPPNTPVPLQDGTVVRIGDRLGNSVSFTYLQSAAPGALAGTLDLGQAQLGGLSRFVIGRDPACNLPINSPVVSWHHAEVLAVAGGGHCLNDLGSTNGTFVNGQRVHSTSLKASDQVQIGPFKLVYHQTSFTKQSSMGSVRLDGIGLRKEVPSKNGKRAILNDITLTILPHEFVALVGGSGAGKSTLMDALNGFRRAHSGQVLINGDDLYQSYDAYRAGLGYVPQSDIIHTGLTVRKALQYTAQLRLPPDTPQNVIDQRIQEALNQVEMSAQIDQQITSLSGGQRKRVSIASEMLSEPSLFFLDEPTSGLDPGLDKKMMFTLNTLADNGRTIVLTTHATNNILGKCDHVAFLAHGRLVYYGPPDKAIQFFKVGEFADIYSKLDTPQEAQQCEATFKASPDYQQYIVKYQASLQRKPPASSNAKKARRLNADDLRAALRQFGILSMRYLNLILNDRVSMFILLAVMPIIGILLLLIANAHSLIGDTQAEIDRLLDTQHYYQIVTDAQKLLLMLSLSVILLGVFAAAYEIIKEKPIYRRERMVNLGIGSYLGSKLAVLLGFGLIQCAALLLVISFKVDFPEDGVFLPASWEMYITLLLAMLVGLAMGLLISAVVQSSNMVIYLVLVVLFVQIIFSGALFSLPEFAQPISYLTPTRWSMEGLGASVDMDYLNGLSKSFIEDVGGMVVNETVDAPVDFEINYASTAGHLVGTWLLQIVFATAFIGLTAFTLKKQDIQT